MPIALWCVMIAGVFPLVCAAVAKASGQKYDNHNPRIWLAQQTGFPARANAAQQNHFEAFPFFAVAVLVAILGGGLIDRVNLLAVAFIVARLLYTVCYFADWAMPRSLMWLAAYGITIALFVQPAFVH
ncbi:MAPEG family protein [Ralstonia mannitolilytica]|uniref:MAPEG family protein n=1 Tax=Ralstonia mannitolilytica TaxID=105219 RepID=UPI0028F59AA7|nr:MAPEG family protein [Ralstonia mannitolilytica]CAJ0742548.1 hypothetical protein R76696_04038 [Ralstonia mannitolilytica]